MRALRTAAAVLAALAGGSCGADVSHEVLRETFYADGSPWTSALVNGDGPEGEARTWWPGGLARTRATYVDGELEGPFASWYADGTPREEATYRAGRLHGARRAWYSNGALEPEGQLADGRRTGPWSFRDTSGAVWVTRDYEPRTGRLVAQSLRLAEQGRVVHCEFEAAELRLRVEASDGSMRRTGVLVGGLRDGDWRRWNDAGVLVLESDWNAGLRHGDWSAWDDTGELLAQGRFERGEREGPWWIREPDGGIDFRQSGSYHLGERIGDVSPDLASPFPRAR